MFMESMNPQISALVKYYAICAFVCNQRAVQVCNSQFDSDDKQITNAQLLNTYISMKCGRKNHINSWTDILFPIVSLKWIQLDPQVNTLNSIFYSSALHFISKYPVQQLNRLSIVLFFGLNFLFEFFKFGRSDFVGFVKHLLHANHFGNIKLKHILDAVLQCDDWTGARSARALNREIIVIQLAWWQCIRVQKIPAFSVGRSRLWIPWIRYRRHPLAPSVWSACPIIPWSS